MVLNSEQAHYLDCASSTCLKGLHLLLKHLQHYLLVKLQVLFVVSHPHLLEEDVLGNRMQVGEIAALSWRCEHS